MSFQQLIVILKGGAGSGNWGHAGRPGKIGGSHKGGGLRRIGAASLDKTSPDYHAGVRIQASKFAHVRNKVKPLIDAVAKELGFDPNRIEYAGQGYEFEVGGTKYRAGGSYSPETGRIKLYEGGFTPDKTQVYKGLVAHEIQHDRFASFMKRADEQNKEVAERLQQESKAGVHYTQSFMKADGTFRDPANNKKYKAMLLRSKLIDDYEALKKADGVSGYSASYWEAFKKSGKTDWFYRAVDETIAEVASLKANGQYDKVKPPWKMLYNEISKYAEN